MHKQEAFRLINEVISSGEIPDAIIFATQCLIREAGAVLSETDFNQPDGDTTLPFKPVLLPLQRYVWMK